MNGLDINTMQLTGYESTFLRLWFGTVIAQFQYKTMSRIIGRNHKYFILSLLVLFFVGGSPVQFGQEKILFQEFLIPKPVIRIALGLNLEDVQIHASLGMKTYRVAKNYKLLAEDASEVRVGDFLIDGAAPGYIKTLNPLGFPEAGIIRVKGRAFGSPLARGLYPRASTAEADPQALQSSFATRMRTAKPGAPAAGGDPGDRHGAPRLGQLSRGGAPRIFLMHFWNKN